MSRRGLCVAVIAGALVGHACSGGGSPTGATTEPDAARGWPTNAVSVGDVGLLAAAPAEEGVVAFNAAPSMSFRTSPPADTSTQPYPTLRGRAPFVVRFNLCESSDPDQNPTEPDAGDTLNWQFHFGDSGTPAFDADGSFNPDADHFCRVEHVYERPGNYVATLSVTDKHLEDQSGRVSAQARVTQKLTVEVADGVGPALAGFSASPSPAPVFNASGDPDCIPGPVPFPGSCNFKVRFKVLHTHRDTVSLTLTPSTATVPTDFGCNTPGGVVFGVITGAVSGGTDVALECAVNSTLSGTALGLKLQAVDETGDEAFAFINVPIK
jgi:hypothetical protein